MEALLERIAHLLERIAQNTEPKSSMQIVVSDNKTRFKTRFNPPIQLVKSKRYEIALVNLETYYSFPNIKSNNNYFSFHPTMVRPGMICMYLKVVMISQI